MKKIMFTAIICLSCFAFAHAQFGITGGGNLSEYKYTSDRSFIFAWNAGIFYRMGSKNSILLPQPTLIYTGKGAEKFTDIDVNEPIEKYINHINYAELSVPFILSIPMDDDDLFKAEFGIGPYAAYVLHATYTAVPYDGERTTGNYKVGNSNTDDFKPFDAGLSLLMGIKLAGLSMNLQYDLGLANTNPVSTQAPLKMRALMFNVLIYFGK